MQTKGKISTTAMMILSLSLLSAGRHVGATGIAGSSCTEATVGELAWLAGYWVGGEGDLRMEQYWMHPRGGVMLGLYREEEGSAGIFFEYLRIECAPEGFVLLGQPQGSRPRPSTSWTAPAAAPRSRTASTIFPSIIYRRAGSFPHARIDREQDGESKFEEFVWSRAGPESGEE